MPGNNQWHDDRVDALIYSRLADQPAAPTVTAVDAENGVIILGEVQQQRVDPEEYWNRYGEIELAMQRLSSESGSQLEVRQRQHQGEWVNEEMRAMPEATTWRIAPERRPDAIETMMRSYACSTPTGYSGVFSVPEDSEDTRPVAVSTFPVAVPPSREDFGCGCSECRESWDREYGHLSEQGRKRAADWGKFWSNLGVAHTAAVFMLEIIWDDKEQRFRNEKTIRSYIGAKTGGD